MLSVLGKNVYQHHSFPSLRIFSSIREVHCGVYSCRHTELSFLNDLDPQKSDDRSLFYRTNWCKFGQVHAEEPKSSGMLRRVD